MDRSQAWDETCPGSPGTHNIDARGDSKYVSESEMLKCCEGSGRGVMVETLTSTLKDERTNEREEPRETFLHLIDQT